MFDTTAEALGKTFVTTELGGGGTARAETVAIAKRGVATSSATPASSTARPEPAPTRGSTCRPATASPSPRTTA